MTAPPTPTGAPLLELHDVHASYGPFRALFGVSFDVRPGEVVALLGSNGAGKTTVARVVSGLLKPTAGSVHLAGEDVTGLRPHRITRRGVTHAPEGRSVFASLSVEENLVLPFRQEVGKAGLSDALARAYELFPLLGERRGQIAGSLSGGEQRMLSLARVLVRPPRLLVADELSLGLAPIVVDEVYQTLARIRDAGTALLLVEQLVQHALGIADRAVVMVKGSVGYFGPVDELGDLAARVMGDPSGDPAGAGGPPPR